jgi:hypothetical protein
MMKKDKRLVLPSLINGLIVFAALSVVTAANAQVATRAEKLFYSASVTNALDHLVDDQRAIYSGSNYLQYYVSKGNDGHPFFQSMKPESIVYEGILYTSIDFIYDVFLDELIILNPDTSWLRLRTDKIAEFRMGGRRFERLDSVAGLKAGFYEILHWDENVSLVAKWSKVFRASVWKEKVDFFILREEVYEIANKKKLIGALSDKQNELQAFIRDNKLPLKKNKASAFTEIVKFYSSLKD